MELSYQLFDFLHLDCKMIRERVFMQEQGFQNEFDNIDDTALHIVVYADNKPAATGRLYCESGEWHIGRIAALSEYRGCSLGSMVVTELEKAGTSRGVKFISLSAQCRAAGFYEKLGYAQTDDLHDDEGCPHVTMVKELKI